MKIVEVRESTHQPPTMDAELEPTEHKALLAAVLHGLISAVTDRDTGHVLGSTAEQIILKTELDGLDKTVTVEDLEPGDLVVLSQTLGAYASQAEFVTDTFNEEGDSTHPVLAPYAEHGPAAQTLSLEMSAISAQYSPKN